jgi:hypothetical protein
MCRFPTITLSLKNKAKLKVTEKNTICVVERMLVLTVEGLVTRFLSVPSQNLVCSKGLLANSILSSTRHPIYKLFFCHGRLAREFISGIFHASRHQV